MKRRSLDVDSYPNATEVHVATITVLKFSYPEGAADALSVVQSLQKEHLIRLIDAAMVSWPVGKNSPATKQLVTPLLVTAIRAAFGALGTAYRDLGIDDEFIDQVRREVKEGTSALFLMTENAVLDRVADAMKTLTFEIFATNLSKEQEQRLRDAFRESEKTLR
jgi:uncharacterized membrane protein